jgi:hypothetical protein
MKRVSGKIISNPAATLSVGRKIHFQPEPFMIEAPEGEHWVTNWDYFDGVLLHLLVVIDGQRMLVHGSAVLVAPGVALAARHVIEPHLPLIQEGRAALACGGLTRSQLMMWECKKITLVDNNSDIAILVLRYSSNLPPGNLFKMAAITTRLPKIGERVGMLGFTAGDHETPVGEDIAGNVHVSVGTITNQHPRGRDRSLLPGPALEVATSSSGGMSGGPVFDQYGLLVGIISTSLVANDHAGPSYVSLLWQALTMPIDAEWPNVIHTPGRPLCEFGRLCSIDRTDVLRRVSDTVFEYTPWDDT